MRKPGVLIDVPSVWRDLLLARSADRGTQHAVFLGKLKQVKNGLIDTIGHEYVETSEYC